MLHDRQAEAGAPRRTRGVGTIEALEDARQVSFGHAGAVIRSGEHRGRVHCVDREREVRTVAGVADRVLGEVLGEHPQHARPQRKVDVRFSVGMELHSRPRRGRSELGDNLLEHGQGRRVPERDDLLAALELREEEDLVDQRSRVLDLGPRLLEQRGHVRVVELGQLEEREDTGERRPQLVGDRGREAHPKLIEAPRVWLRLGRHDAVARIVARPRVVHVPRHQIVTIPTP
jgi:hypothetical protein